MERVWGGRTEEIHVQLDVAGQGKWQEWVQGSSLSPWYGWTVTDWDGQGWGQGKGRAQFWACKVQVASGMFRWKCWIDSWIQETVAVKCQLSTKHQYVVDKWLIKRRYVANFSGSTFCYCSKRSEFKVQLVRKCCRFSIPHARNLHLCYSQHQVYFANNESSNFLAVILIISLHLC